MNYKRRAIIKRPDEKYGHVTNISTSLENLQKTVEGYLDPHWLPDGKNIMLVNKDGRLLELPHNFGPYLGTVVVLGEEVDGEWTDCTMDFKTWKWLVDLWR